MKGYKKGTQQLLPGSWGGGEGGRKEQQRRNGSLTGSPASKTVTNKGSPPRMRSAQERRWHKKRNGRAEHGATRGPVNGGKAVANQGSPGPPVIRPTTTRRRMPLRCCPWASRRIRNKVQTTNRKRKCRVRYATKTRVSIQYTSPECKKVARTHGKDITNLGPHEAKASALNHAPFTIYPPSAHKNIPLM